MREDAAAAAISSRICSRVTAERRSRPCRQRGIIAPQVRHGRPLDRGIFCAAFARARAPARTAAGIAHRVSVTTLAQQTRSLT